MKRNAFLWVLVIGSAVPAAIAWLCNRSLDSGADPRQITIEFMDMQSVLTWFVPLIFGCLLMIQMRAYAHRVAPAFLFVVAWIYFASFSALDYIWLSEVLFHHTQASGTWEGGFNAMGVVGIALVVAGAPLATACFLVAARRHARQSGASCSSLPSN